MHLTSLDYSILIFFFALVLSIGIIVSKKSGSSSSEYFLSGRNLPWWLLGFSMVATTFAADTPLFVADVVRTDGVSGNWIWWAFLLTGMLTVFLYAKLWRKSGVTTDIEFYELRYSGKPAKFLRGFRAVYLGLVFNVLVMSAVTLAAIKIGGVMLGVKPWEVVVYAGIITVIFSTIGGFRGVVYTDFILFIIAMIGAIAAAYYAVNLPQVGGLEALLANEVVAAKLSILPDFNNTELVITILIIPLAVQWWSTWYPGAEPGGGGYIAQRMLAAKNERHAIGATFFFNIMHYALRPWPWILVALASLVVFPDLASLQTAFPHIEAGKLGHDLAYPAMLNFLPNGLLGLVLASLTAAYMSTISTHLNWGASYLVNDFYKRFIKPNAPEKELVMVGRFSTVLLMVFSALLALFFQNAKQVFGVIILFGAGTGLLFILRWFWWRINAWSEISAMLASGIIAISLEKNAAYLFGVEGILPTWSKFPLVVLLTTLTWLTVTFLTKPETSKTLQHFYLTIQPGGIGWRKVVKDAQDNGITIEKPQETTRFPQAILAVFISTVLVYSMLFATGHWIYGNTTVALLFTSIVIISIFLLIKLWKYLKRTI
ncbi:MAG: sodium:solute symporter family protein [Flavobacteriaceae bacterium]|nr:sodium:solute symporter family protein [Flavobacteriaceae bacterium]